MKTIIMAVFILLAGTAGFAQVKKAPAHKKHHHGTVAHKYTCPMHPEVAMNKPGKCPKCGMNLEAMKMKKMKSDKPMGEMKM